MESEQTLVSGVEAVEADTDETTGELVLEAWSPYLALLVACTATLGSLYFSQVRHFIPCELCWFQRIFMYPLTIVLAVGILRRDRNLPAFVIPLAVIGACFSVYHLLLQKTHLLDDVAACSAAVPCSSDWIDWFGFVTIPMLALLAFLLILFSMSAARRGADDSWAAPGPAPWRNLALTLLVALPVAMTLFILVDRSA